MNRRDRRAAKRLHGKRGEHLRELPEGCPDPETELLYPATGIVTPEDDDPVAALMFPAQIFPRWSKCVAAHEGGWVKGEVYIWSQKGASGRYGAGMLLDILVGTEQIFAGVDLLEVPAWVDLFTKTGKARLYSDLMHPGADVPVSPEAAALGIEHQGRVDDEPPYMQLQIEEAARHRARMFFESIYPNARPK